jgi:hypothetical protein
MIEKPAPSVGAGAPRPKNKASIRVTYPDGCRASWDTKPDAAIARDAKLFGEWLIRLGEDIKATAMTEVMCAKS